MAEKSGSATRGAWANCWVPGSRSRSPAQNGASSMLFKLPASVSAPTTNVTRQVNRNLTGTAVGFKIEHGSREVKNFSEWLNAATFLIDTIIVIE